MIQANHPRFSCTSDMSLTIYGIIFSGPLMHTDTPTGTGVIVIIDPCLDINRCLHLLGTFYAFFCKSHMLEGK